VFYIFFCVVIATNIAFNVTRTLASLTFCGFGSGKQGDPVTVDTGMTSADFSNKGLGASGAKVLVAFMSRKCFQNSGALDSLNLARNYLGAEGARHIAEVLPKW
jgi:hypothetical protein